MISTHHLNSKDNIPSLYRIRLTNCNWETVISSEDYENLLQAGTFNGRKTYDLTALLMPIRTHALKAFLQDLTLPLVFNVALKVADLWPRIFSIAFSVCLDLATLPIRMITALPRYLYLRQPSKEEHPFYKFLEEKGFDVTSFQKEDCYDIELLNINKKWYQAGGLFDLKGGIWTTYEESNFKINLVETAFVFPQFVKNSARGWGRSFGSDFYKRCYLEAYPNTSELEFQVIEEQHTAYLQQTKIHPFIEELRKYIPEALEELEEQGLTTSELLKESRKAFNVKYHPDKGGNEQIFAEISAKWTELMKS